MTKNHEPKPWNNLSEDAVYAELHNESRRFRDYQLEFAKWSVSLMFAFAGGYLALATHGFTPGIYSRLLLAFAVLGLSIGSILVIRHTNKRFKEIRAYTESIRPHFMNFEPPDKCLTPHRVMVVLISVLAFVVCVFIAIYPPWPNTCRLTLSLGSDPPTRLTSGR